MAHTYSHLYGLPATGLRFFTVYGPWGRPDMALFLFTKAILAGEGVKADTPDTAIAAAYARDETDEFITPSVIGDYDGAKDGDGLFFANFRADRAREILNAMIVPGFDGYETGPRPEFSAVLGMVEYSDALNAHMDVMFPWQDIADTLGSFNHPDVAAAIRQSVAAKKEGHEINTARFIQPARPMYSIGG